MVTDGLIKIIQEESAQNSVDWRLVYGIIRAETGFRAAACRYESHYQWLFSPDKFAKTLGQTIETEIIQQKTSWGMMQIMGGVAREIGFKDYMPVLTVPSQGIRWGCKKLLLLQGKYPGRVADVVASYNAGSPRRQSDGRYVNEGYIQKVLIGFQEAEKLALNTENGDPG